jgi:hypothetical protein
LLSRFQVHLPTPDLRNHTAEAWVSLAVAMVQPIVQCPSKGISTFCLNKASNAGSVEEEANRSAIDFICCPVSSLSFSASFSSCFLFFPILLSVWLKLRLTAVEESFSCCCVIGQCFYYVFPAFVIFSGFVRLITG